MEMKAHPTSGYLVNEDGTVIVNPYTGFTLTPTLSPAGYLKIGNYICSSGMVHQLVYEAFVRLRDKDKQINHKDGNKTNNHFSNLEEVTPSENTKHAYIHGLASGKAGDKNSMAKLTDESFEKLLTMLGDGYCNECVGNAYGLHSRYVSLIRHGKRWTSFVNGRSFPKSNKNRCYQCTATTIPEGSRG